MHPNIGTTYLRTMPKDLRRRLAVKTAVRSLGIIKDSVFLNHLLCLQWIVKEISAQTFVSKLAVEALKVSVLPRAAFFSELMAYAIFLNKPLESQASELSPLIGSNNSGHAIELDAFFKNLNYGFSRNAEPDINTRRQSAEEVFNCHNFYASAICKSVKEEIYSPDMIAKQRLYQGHPDDNLLFIFTGSESLQVETFIDTIDSLSVSSDASPIYGKMDAPVAVKGIFKGYLLYHLSKRLIFVCLSRLIIQSAERNFKNVSSFSGGYPQLNHLFSYHSPFMDCQKFFLTNISKHLDFQFFFSQNPFKSHVLILKNFKPFGIIRGHAFEFLFPFVKGASTDRILTAYLGYGITGEFSFRENLYDPLNRILCLFHNLHPFLGLYPYFRCSKKRGAGQQGARDILEDLNLRNY